MVNSSGTLDRIFGALADPTRRGMLHRLSRGSASIGELGEPYEMTKGAISKHVKALESAGLLQRQIDGRIHRCALATDQLAIAERWVSDVRAYWEARFDDLANYLEELQSGATDIEERRRDR